MIMAGHGNGLQPSHVAAVTCACQFWHIPQQNIDQAKTSPHVYVCTVSVSAYSMAVHHVDTLFRDTQARVVSFTQTTIRFIKPLRPGLRSILLRFTTAGCLRFQISVGNEAQRTQWFAPIHTGNTTPNRLVTRY